MGWRALKLSRLAELASAYYEEFASSLEEYKGGSGSIYAVERLAQLLAQSILYYAAILASKESGLKPGSYRELALYLSHKLGLSRREAEFLKALAGFRNVLVHMYATLDRDLEEKAFDEIAAMAPRIIEKLRGHARSDPCMDDVAQRLEGVAERLGIKCMIIFGSIARRGCGNDVDIAIYIGGRPSSLLDVGRIQVELEHAAGARVDLVVMDLDIDPVLAKTILDEGVVIYSEGGACDDALLRIYKVYLDYASTPRFTMT